MLVEPIVPTMRGFEGDVHCAKTQALPRGAHSLRVPGGME